MTDNNASQENNTKELIKLNILGTGITINDGALKTLGNTLLAFINSPLHLKKYYTDLKVENLKSDMKLYEQQEINKNYIEQRTIYKLENQSETATIFKNNLEHIARDSGIEEVKRIITQERSKDSEDIIRKIMDESANFSEEDFHKIWADILTEELKQPNTVTRKTIQLMLTLNNDILKKIEKIFPYIIHNNRNLYVLSKNIYKSHFYEYDFLFILEDLGLIQITGQPLTLDAQTPLFYNDFIITRESSFDNIYPKFKLTRSAIEIYKLKEHNIKYKKEKDVIRMCTGLFAKSTLLHPDDDNNQNFIILDNKDRKDKSLKEKSIKDQNIKYNIQTYKNLKILFPKNFLGKTLKESKLKPNEDKDQFYTIKFNYNKGYK